MRWFHRRPRKLPEIPRLARLGELGDGATAGVEFIASGKLPLNGGYARVNYDDLDIQSGDLIVVFWVSRWRSAEISADFSLLDYQSDPYTGIYTRICDGTESGYSSNFSNYGSYQSGVYVHLRGAADPAVAGTHAEGTGYAGSYNIPTVNGITSGSVMSLIGVGLRTYEYTSNAQWNGPTGYEELVAASESDSTSSMLVAKLEEAVPTAGSLTCGNASGDSQSYKSHHVVIEPS